MIIHIRYRLTLCSVKTIERSCRGQDLSNTWCARMKGVFEMAGDLVVVVRDVPQHKQQQLGRHGPHLCAGTVVF